MRINVGRYWSSGVLGTIAVSAIVLAATVATGSAQTKKPNIIVIMGDDVGWFNIGAYHQGIMSGKTPNLDKLASRRHAVHRLLRRSQLHRRPRQFHHRRTAYPHGFDDRRPSGSGCGLARSGRHYRYRAQSPRATKPASLARTTSAT